MKLHRKRICPKTPSLRIYRRTGYRRNTEEGRIGTWSGYEYIDTYSMKSASTGWNLYITTWMPASGTSDVIISSRPIQTCSQSTHACLRQRREWLARCSKLHPNQRHGPKSNPKEEEKIPRCNLWNCLCCKWRTPLTSPVARVPQSKTLFYVHVWLPVI